MGCLISYFQGTLGAILRIDFVRIMRKAVQAENVVSETIIISLINTIISAIRRAFGYEFVA